MKKIAIPSVPARYLLWAMQLAEAHGADCAGVPEAGGVTRAELENVSAMLTQRQFDRCLYKLLQVSCDRALGFNLGMHLQISSHDILGYALLSSTTLDQSSAGSPLLEGEVDARQRGG